MLPIKNMGFRRSRLFGLPELTLISKAVPRLVPDFLTHSEWADASHRGQTGDPFKGAAAIVMVATSGAPPLRLQLGADAVAALEAKLAQVSTELAAWRKLAESTGDEH